jgi:hypothetical protein
MNERTSTTDKSNNALYTIIRTEGTQGNSYGRRTTTTTTATATAGSWRFGWHCTSQGSTLSGGESQAMDRWILASQPPIDRRSLEHLVDFLDSNNGGDEVIITELVLDHVQLSEPSDGGFGSITYLCLPGATRR